MSLKVADFGYILEQRRIVLFGAKEELDKIRKIGEAYLSM